MNGLNRVMLLGNLGSDPELRFTQGGQAVLHIRMATTESYLDKDKVRQERTDWHNVVVWGKRGEALAKILTKGSTVLIEGSLRTSSYDDRDGNKKFKTEVNAHNILLTGSKPPAGQADSTPVPRETARGAPPARGGDYSRGAPPRQQAGAPPAEDYDGGGYGSDPTDPF